MNVQEIQEKIEVLRAECDVLIKKSAFTKQDQAAVDLRMQKIGELRDQLKRLSVTDAERRERARNLVIQTSGPDALLSAGERASVRSLLLTPAREERTYSAMSEGTATAGGNFVPQGFYYKLTQALKASDALFDDSVTLPLYTDNGAPLTAPFVNDTGTSASVVSENSQSSESEPATISRLSFSKTPTFRTGQCVVSLELLQDSAFPIEDAVVVPLAQKRIQRGVGAAGVTALLAGASSGVSSASTASVVVDDVLALLESLDPAYLSGPRSFIAVNAQTLYKLMRQSSTTGSLIWKPRYDSNGRPLLGNVPVIVCPSLPNVATGNKAVVAGDFTALIHRQTRSVNVRRYQDNVALAEQGMVAFEVFARHDFGVIDSSALKYITVS